MIDKIKKLMEVKSIMTIAFTFCFCYLTLTNSIQAEDFMSVFLVLITYYFTRKEPSN